MKAFEQKVRKTYNLGLIELNKRINGINGEATYEQLSDVILPELLQLMNAIKNKKLPNRDSRYLNSFANAFTAWGWDMEKPTELFTMLAELNNEYKKL